MNEARLDALLSRFPERRVCVLGDLFLDKYLDIDDALHEDSLETGLRAWQVTGVRYYPGAGGNVAKDLATLGVRTSMVSVVGADGHGSDVRRALQRVGVDDSGVVASPDLLTPTHEKPLVRREGAPPEELSRFDIKNHTPLPADVEAHMIERARAAVDEFDALIVMDQAPERNAGAVTDALRGLLRTLCAERPEKLVYVDSRTRIGEYPTAVVKPNDHEARAALGLPADEAVPPTDLAAQFAAGRPRPVFVTFGAAGLVVVDGGKVEHVPAYPVTGPIDIVGAGDATTAGIVAALSAGASPPEAALLGSLAASITIQQLGVTGQATPEQVRERHGEHARQRGDSPV